MGVAPPSFYLRGSMSFPYPYKGPIPPENNPPITPQYYAPSQFTIANIALGASTLVTTSIDHNYVIGQQIRLHVPEFYGSYQLNNQIGYVTSIPTPNEVVVNINSQNANQYIASPVYGPTPPQIISIGDINSGGIRIIGTISASPAVPGSFINISPE